MSIAVNVDAVARVLTTEGAVAIVTQLLDFLLFQRGQIPCAFNLLSKLSLDSDEDDRKPINELVHSTDKLKDTLAAALQDQLTKTMAFSQHRLTCAFVLGATLMTPKEVYIVKFSNLNSDAQPSDQDAANQLGRHCIRQIISQTSSASYPATGLTRLRALVLAPRSSDLPASGFIPKQTLNLNKGRAFTVSVNVSATDVLSSDDKMVTSVDDADLIWFEAPLAIQGFQT